VGVALVIMGRLNLVLFLSVLMLASYVPLSLPTEAAGGRSLVDFAVMSITVGNASTPAQTWEQPDGSSEDYIVRNRQVEITVTFKQAGSSNSNASSTLWVQIWHPVGTLVQELQVNLTGAIGSPNQALIGGEERVEKVVWTPTAAHSILDDNGTLSGGYIVKGIIHGLVDDGNDANDELSDEVPVAIWYDSMDRGLCFYDPCNQGISYYTPTFASLGYDASTGNADGYGPWRLDNTSAAVGTSHWRHSAQGQDYESMGNDWLRWGWVTPAPGGQLVDCNPANYPVDPGFGYGIGDTDITNRYGLGFCRISMSGYDYVSMQLTSQAYGGLGSGDEVSLIIDDGNSLEKFNLSTAGVSPTTNDWTRLIWNLTGVKDTGAYVMGLHFASDSGGATSGMHIDEWLLFAVQKVDEFTVTVECDNPETGYIVIPADPLPPVLYCTLTNNGYRTKTLQIVTEVSNQTWMIAYSPLRIDSDNLNDHDNAVPLNPLPAGQSTEFWINLTVPPGANVEELNWTVEFRDYYTGDVKESMLMPLSVDASYSVQVKYVGPLVAQTLGPEETGLVKMTLTNTGNQMAYWNLAAYFNRSEWGPGHVRFLNSSVNFSEITYLQLEKAASQDFWIEFIGPDDIGPGLTEVTVLASGQSPATAQETRKIQILTPTEHNLSMVPSQNKLTAQADGHTRTVDIEVTNFGNDLDRFDLSLTADWTLGVTTHAQSTEEIGPFGDSSTVLLIFPMTYGIRADTYIVVLEAVSRSDPTYVKSVQIELEVLTTYLLEVSDVDMSGQTFQGGADAKTTSFEVSNVGNDFDSIHVELITTPGMSADIIPNEQYNPASPSLIEKGTSVNVTVSYSFDEGFNGQAVLKVKAYSEQSGRTVSDEGEATFQVGSQGWIELTPGPVVVLDDAGWIYVNVTVHNRHPTNDQLIVMEVEPTNEARKHAKVRIRTQDGSFVLAPDLQRTASVKFEITETQFLNLPDDDMLFYLTVTATGDDDVAQTTVTVRVLRDPSLVGGGDADAQGGASIMTWVTVIGGILLAAALIGVLVMVVISTSREEEEISSLAGYQSQLEATYGSVPDAPIVPDAGVPLPPPTHDPPAVTTPSGVPPESPPAAAAPELPAGAPPLPPDGLPAGWDMEQWGHYGQQYLEQHGLA
jgi:uncharacterized membrane protein